MVSIAVLYVVLVVAGMMLDAYLTKKALERGYEYE